MRRTKLCSCLALMAADEENGHTINCSIEPHSDWADPTIFCCCWAVGCCVLWDIPIKLNTLHTLQHPFLRFNLKFDLNLTLTTDPLTRGNKTIMHAIATLCSDLRKTTSHSARGKVGRKQGQIERNILFHLALVVSGRRRGEGSSS